MLDPLKNAAVYFLDWNLERIGRCLETLREEQIWARPNGHSNSIGNQVLHLEGNIRQWAVHGLGGANDVRQRDAEFAATGGVSKAELLARLSAVIAAAKSTVLALTEAQLREERKIQAYVHDGVFILLHVVEHLSYHTGQIVFWTKALQDRDLGFYAGVALDTTN
ncbi:DinB family protein [Neolewinella lacunae]|uniref:DUF1572 family protein n=1 Tax=Neolewinella lacunae TaxID=1517758 RepID=A0A923PTV5_9BACT|nr:DinB family protein [Neolewinella lacunae]MBC6996727.1 DUF1572 family protein [Neolewinella lacunae]MDN3633408.1 DinB family protein [Neolewinella lacunae]